MKVPPPKLPRALDDATSITLHTDDVFEGIRVVGLDAAATRATNVFFDECELRKASLAGAKLEKLQLRDVRLVGGDWTAANASDSGILRVAFDDVRMTGFDISRSKCKDVTFTNCKLDMSNFRFATLQNIRFEDCNLTDCDFQSAQLTNIVFRNCTMEKVLLNNARCKHVDLRSSQVSNLRGWQSASGVIIDSVQLMHLAPELAQELNISVSDD